MVSGKGTPESNPRGFPVVINYGSFPRIPEGVFLSQLLF